MAVPDRVTKAARAGKAVYTPWTPDLYDPVVLSLSNPLIRKCPTRLPPNHSNRHLTPRHRDVGVGTGRFLDHCRFLNRHPQITLLDFNPVRLKCASTTIGRSRPMAVQTDVLEPIRVVISPFASIGLNYVLHCLPGSLVQKAVAFDPLKPFLAPGGVVFGASLLSQGVERSRPAQALVRFYNRRGIFSNEQTELTI